MVRFVFIFLICTFFIKYSSILSQPIPDEFFYKKSREILYDTGENWSTLSSFSSIRYRDTNLFRLKKTTPKIHDFNLIVGIEGNNKSITTYGLGHFKFKNHFYGYCYPKSILKNNAINNDYNIKSLKFTPVEIDLSGIGYQNDWFWMQLSRGRENWGAGGDIELALSDNNNNSYDYFLFGSDYGRLRVNYIHGFLETIENEINRYITARGIEWTNKKSLLIGLSETVIYSGKNRFMDIGYLNPISSHLEIELNNRLNIVGSQNSNAVWQIHIDLLMKKNFRLSANYLFDEFVIDKDIEKNKEHGEAYSFRGSYNLINTKRNILSINSAVIKIGTPTFRHSNGPNNFVNSARPLGWQKGSDGLEYQFGLVYFNRRNIIVLLNMKNYSEGSENILSRPYDPYKDYLAGSFPSGSITKSRIIEASLEWWYKPHVSITIQTNFKMYRENNNESGFEIKLNAFLGKIYETVI